VSLDNSMVPILRWASISTELANLRMCRAHMSLNALVKPEQMKQSVILKKYGGNIGHWRPDMPESIKILR
jgi:hypothetical protein